MTDAGSTKKQPESRMIHTRTYVEGSVMAERDVVQGDQYNYFGAGGLAPEDATPADIAAALKQLQEALARLKQATPPEEAPIVDEVVEQVAKAADDAAKPEPPGKKIVAKLTGAKAVLDTLALTIPSAVQVGTLLGKVLRAAAAAYGLVPPLP